MKFDTLLQTGQLLFVIDGPERASDYDWYLVRPISERVERDGWVAAADHDGTPWLGPATIPCGAEPGLGTLGRMEEAVRVHCYGSREFTFTDTLWIGPMCGDPSVLAGPPLLADCQSVFYFGAEYGMPIALPPDVVDVSTLPFPDPFAATATAHMDDSAARTCEPTTGYGEGELDLVLLRVSTVLDCRATFVATSFVRLAP